ncbi:MAG: metalloregulator ArsR/SmtB family transcription factor [Ilumatobacteraceae bacterium]|nr:metalloregulator ArsR/SmtB family transcription factor [Ilumatobacteraceae bacterium]
MESPLEPPYTIATATKLFCSFADQTRLAIITVLAGGEQRVTDIVEALGASQANISGHLKCLKECGVVIDRRSGREAFYRIAHPEVIDVLRSAERLLEITGTRIELCPNYLPQSSAS